MKSSKRLIIVLTSLALLSGCASIEHTQTVKKLTKVSPNIALAPAIDVPYSEVIESNHSNLTVRWGGEVIQSSKISDTLVRLTIASLPLDKSGLPVKQKKDTSNANFFAVDLNENFAQSVDLNGHLVTLYGDLAEQKVVSINNQQISVPSIKLTEIVDWDLHKKEQLAQLRREDPYYYHNVKSYRYSLESLERGFGSRLGSFGRSRIGGRR